jgi:response regulator RpfG family c-di-GMP phosphodiesterase
MTMRRHIATSRPPPAASILVVDDEINVRQLMERWLTAGGYDVRTAGTADEALDRVHDRAPAEALSATVGTALRLSADDMVSLERAALLHDLGKLAMPDAVLRKPAPLTSVERDLVRLHPQIAADLMAAVPFLSVAANLVRDAYERVDGLGYPNGMQASDVAIGSRIISVADAFDAMTRARVFRDAISPREALLELERCAGTQFDATVVATFTRAIQI